MSIVNFYFFSAGEPDRPLRSIGYGTRRPLSRYASVILTQGKNVYNAGMDLIVQSLTGNGPGDHNGSRFCPVCGSRISRSLLDRKNARIYLTCDTCRYIFLHPDHHLPPDAQKRRYLRHRNGLQEEGYITFLNSFLQTAVIPYVECGTRVLDYGSGPVPAFSWILHSSGYRVDSFDPFFFPDTSWEKKTYSAAVMIEVLEHLTDPVSTMRRLRDHIEPGGYLCIRSSLHHDADAHFSSWWYRQDPTHVAFFSETTIEYLTSALGLKTVSITDKRDIVLQRPAEPS